MKSPYVQFSIISGDSSNGSALNASCIGLYRNSRDSSLYSIKSQRLKEYCCKSCIHYLHGNLTPPGKGLVARQMGFLPKPQVWPEKKHNSAIL